MRDIFRNIDVEQTFKSDDGSISKELIRRGNNNYEEIEKSLLKNNKFIGDFDFIRLIKTYITNRTDESPIEVKHHTNTICIYMDMLVEYGLGCLRVPSFNDVKRIVIPAYLPTDLVVSDAELSVDENTTNNISFRTNRKGDGKGVKSFKSDSLFPNLEEIYLMGCFTAKEQKINLPTQDIGVYDPYDERPLEYVPVSLDFGNVSFTTTDIVKLRKDDDVMFGLPYMSEFSSDPIETFSRVRFDSLPYNSDAQRELDLTKYICGIYEFDREYDKAYYYDYDLLTATRNITPFHDIPTLMGSMKYVHGVESVVFGERVLYNCIQENKGGDIYNMVDLKKVVLVFSYSEEFTPFYDEISDLDDMDLRVVSNCHDLEVVEVVFGSDDAYSNHNHNNIESIIGNIGFNSSVFDSCPNIKKVVISINDAYDGFFMDRVSRLTQQEFDECFTRMKSVAVVFMKSLLSTCGASHDILLSFEDGITSTPIQFTYNPSTGDYGCISDINKLRGVRAIEQ